MLLISYAASVSDESSVEGLLQLVREIQCRKN